MEMCSLCHESLKFTNKFQEKLENAIKRINNDDSQLLEYKFEVPEVDETKPLVNEMYCEQNIKTNKKDKKKKRPFQCRICCRTFALKGLLQQHEERHSSKQKQWACNICGKMFLVKPHLKNHECVNHVN